MATTDVVRGFIVDELKFPGAPDQLGDDFPLLERGVLDSTGIVLLLDFAESHFGIVIDEEELVPENFATIADIGALIDSK